ncbi:MAG: serine/threonine protein kinase [Vicinamibacteria bacterium]|jgi:serine/threonine-protein kinase|nr:serine/threonine protein kinase [Vicinamibacteria bacterium]
MSLLREGQLIRGTYEVERPLGEGAFAEVYRVKHRFLGRQAMKVFKMVGMTMEETEQMLGEAILLSRIGHPNIVRVFDANVTETSRGTCGFFTMEYVAGGSLEQFWRSHGAQFVPVETAVEILRQVCRGLALAHAEVPPIIHRDIKPQNILVGYDQNGLQARISDFGLAKRVNPLTLLASARGTRSFKAPEALRDFQTDSAAGDVWALGCTLYLLLTDRLPYAGLGDTEAAADPGRFERPLIPPSRLNAKADAGLDQILFRALSLKPEERHPSARELLADLERWQPAGAGAPGARAKGSGLDESKSALGMHTPGDQRQAETMARQAVSLARERGRFADAADQMEEAFNKWPDLRERYANQVRLWRRGVAM